MYNISHWYCGTWHNIRKQMWITYHFCGRKIMRDLKITWDDDWLKMLTLIPSWTIFVQMCREQPCVPSGTKYRLNENAGLNRRPALRPFSIPSVEKSVHLRQNWKINVIPYLRHKVTVWTFPSEMKLNVWPQRKIRQFSRSLFRFSMSLPWRSWNEKASFKKPEEVSHK